MDKKISFLESGGGGGGGEDGGSRAEQRGPFCPLGSQSEHRIPFSLGQPD